MRRPSRTTYIPNAATNASLPAQELCEALTSIPLSAWGAGWEAEDKAVPQHTELSPLPSPSRTGSPSQGSLLLSPFSFLKIHQQDFALQKAAQISRQPLTGSPLLSPSAPVQNMKPLLSQVQANSFPSGLISPCFLLISKSLGAWRWLGGVNSPVSIACCPVLAAGVWGNVFPWALRRRVPDRGCEVEQLAPHSALLEIISRKAPEVQHQADKTT